MRLDQLAPGHSAIILEVVGEGLLKRRLLKMGLTPHTHVQCQKGALFNDPMKLYLRNYLLTIRKSDASMIVIEEIDQ